jgi:ribonuclease HI
MESTTDIRMYADGSGYKGHIGAGLAVPEMGIVNMAYLGAQKQSTVYAAELKGICMALSTVKKNAHKRAWRTRRVKIYSDNQAALRALIRPRIVSGQAYLHEAIETLHWCESNDIPISFHWIPGHEGIPGNKAAGKAAKDAAEGGYIQIRDGQTYWLAAAAKQQIRQCMTDAWEKLWGNQKSAKPTKRLIDKPHKKILTYWSGLRKATTSILIQLRTGKIGLSHYLSRIKVRDSARCECNLGSQTPRHVVLICPLLQGILTDLIQ